VGAGIDGYGTMHEIVGESGSSTGKGCLMAVATVLTMTVVILVGLAVLA
jgi:hypothetical protein